MANYSITINSKFRPFSFQEMMAPLTIMEQNHREVEEQYANLMTESAKWENLANEQTDKIAYNQYKRYALDLELAADKLAKEGITANSRPSMYKLKSRYNSEIAPIEAAYNLRAADIKAQNDFEAATGGQAIFTKRASTASLDDYLNGKPMDYGRTNLDAVQKEGMLGGAAISKRYIRTTEGKLFQNDYYNLKTTTGLSEEEILNILNRSGKYPNFEKFINDTLSKHGYSNYSDIDKLKMESALLTGINMGITHEESNNPMKNWRAEEDYKAALELDTYEKKKAIDYNDYINKLIAKNSLNGAPEDDVILGVLGGNSRLEGDINGSYEDLRQTLYTRNGGINATFSGLPKKLTQAQKDKIYKDVEKDTTIRPEFRAHEATMRIMQAEKGYSFINPLAKKQDRDQLAKIYKKEEKITRKGSGVDWNKDIVVGTRYVTDWDKVNEVLKKKYGNSKTITDSQEKQLRQLGYTANNKFEDFTPEKLSDRIDKSVKKYTATSIMQTKNDYIDSRMKGSLKAKLENDDKSFIYKYKKGKRELKPVKLEDFVNDKGVVDLNIDELAYDISEPRHFVIRDNRRGDFLVPINDIMPKLGAYVERMINSGEIERAKKTPDQLALAGLQDAIASEALTQANSFNRIQGSTDGKGWSRSSSDEDEDIE